MWANPPSRRRLAGSPILADSFGLQKRQARVEGGVVLAVDLVEHLSDLLAGPVQPFGAAGAAGRLIGVILGVAGHCHGVGVDFKQEFGSRGWASLLSVRRGRGCG